MAIHWYLIAFLVLLFSSALSSWSLPTLPTSEFRMTTHSMTHFNEPHLKPTEFKPTSKSNHDHLFAEHEILRTESFAKKNLDHAISRFEQPQNKDEKTPVDNRKEAARDQSKQSAMSIPNGGEKSGNSLSIVNEEFKAALKRRNWNEVMKMEVDEIIPELVFSNNPELLEKVLREGRYDPKTLQSDPNIFLMRDSQIMSIDGELKLHFDLAMKENKPDFVADLVCLDLVDVKEVLELSTKNQEFYNALVQNPIIQKRLVTNNDVETIRSLIKKGSVRAEDVLKEATKTSNFYVTSSIVDPKTVKNDLTERFNNGQWDQLTQMNLKNVDINDLLHPKVISKLEKQPRVLRYLLSQGSFSLESVLQSKNELKPNSPLTSLLESAVDKRLSELKDVNKLSSLVEGKKIKLDRIMDLADETTLKSLVKTKAIQDSLFTSNDVDNVRLLASKDVLTVQEVINLAKQYRNRNLKKEFENYQKKSIPIKISLPQTVLHGDYKPVEQLSNDKWPRFESGNYPEVELKGKMFNPVKILGQGADGQVVSYQNKQDPNEFFAVKIGLFQEPDFRLQNPQREELYLAKKANLIKGKSATLNGYSFTPMKLIKGEPYFDIVRSKEFQRPDELLEQINAVDKAIEEMSKSGVEHRDLHLNNIMYDPITNKATIIDFGRSASSSVTDYFGQKLQLNPYADRKRFLLDMRRQLTFIKNENAKLKNRFNYEPVEKLIGERWNLADKVESVNAANTGSLKELLPSKQAKFSELEKQTKSISDKSRKGKKDWKDLKNLSKQKKHLIREIGSLQHDQLLSKLGVKNNPVEREKIEYARRGNIQNLDFENRYRILQLKSEVNEKLAKAHEQFQEAKLNLKGKSKSSLPSESSEGPNKKKKSIFQYLFNS